MPSWTDKLKDLKDKLPNGEELKKGFGSATEKASELAGQAGELAKQGKAAFDDAVENPDTLANKMKIKALQDKLAQAEYNWKAVYVHEMLGAVEGSVESGADHLANLKIFAQDAAVYASKGASRAKALDLANDISAIEKFLASGKAEKDIYGVYDILTALPAKYSAAMNDSSIGKVAIKHDGDTAPQVVAERYDYVGRMQSAIKKAEYDELIFIGSNHWIDAIKVTQEEFDQIADSETLKDDKAVLAAVEALEIMQGAVARMNPEAELSSGPISGLTEALGEYNLRVGLKAGALAAAKSAGNQIKANTEAYTGQAISWVANKLKK